MTKKDGFGKYNYALLLVCSLTVLSSGSDVFSMSFIVPASSCDLNINLNEQGVLSAIPFIGMVSTLFLWGYLADRKGRRTILIYSMIGTSVFGFLSSFSPNWIVMAVFRFLSASFSSGSNSIAFVIVGECCPDRHRPKFLLIVTSGMMFCQCLSAGLSIPLLPLNFSYPINFLGINYRPWRLLVQLLAIPSALSALCLYFIYESPRYLASVKREQEAKDVLAKIYNVNTGDAPCKYKVKDLHLDEITTDNVSFLSSMWSSMKIMFKPPLLKYSLLLYWIAVINYSINTGSVMWLPYIINGYWNGLLSDEKGNDEVNICGLLEKTMKVGSVSNITESIIDIEPECNNVLNPIAAFTAIGLAFYTFILNLGISFIPNKKYVTVTVFAGSGICAVLTSFIYNPSVSAILFFLSISTGLVNGVISLYFVELFPTSVRGTVSSLGIMVGRISGFTCITITGYVIEDYCNTVFQTFGSILIVGCISSLLLPKNKNSKQRKET